MPEEINRVVTDSISDLLLVSEEAGIENLRREGISDRRVQFVGNLMVDSLLFHLEEARRAPLARNLGVVDGQFGLVTLHRPANVDNPDKLALLLRALNRIAEDIPLYFPVHPRTKDKLVGLPLKSRITLLESLGYVEFLSMMIRSAVTLTDSGGIQEETTALGIPCLTLRDNTERPITVSLGTNRLAGTTLDTITACWQEFKRDPKQGRRPPLWDGHTAERCCEAIARHFQIA